MMVKHELSPAETGRRRLVADAFVRFNDRESVVSTDVDRFESEALRFSEQRFRRACPGRGDN